MIGRPPIFKTPEQLEKKIQEYLDVCKNESIPLTITGLCYHCGFESRQSFYDLEKREGFSYTIKKGRLAIEGAYELRLHGNASGGAIFALKNLGWTDQQHFKHDLSYSDISDAELISKVNNLLATKSKG